MTNDTIDVATDHGGRLPDCWGENKETGEAGFDISRAALSHRAPAGADNPSSKYIGMTMTEQTTASQATGSAGREQVDLAGTDPLSGSRCYRAGSAFRAADAWPRRDRADRHRLSLYRRPGLVRRSASLIFSDIPNDRLMRWDEETGALSRVSQARRLSGRQHARPARPADRAPNSAHAINAHRA